MTREGQTRGMGLRRVVTGVDAGGKSVFVSDGPVEPVTLSVMPGFAFQRMWGEDVTPAAPQDGSEPAGHAYFPPAGGYRVGTFSVPPDSTPPPEGLDMAAGMAEVESRLPGLLAHMEPDAPGMHTTVTIDFEYVVSGRVVLELDDGASVELGPGDTVVQNGTRHRWRNPFDEPATLVVVLIGATPA
jgi:mannose-6-phosphate isomerase-like protein (cupin superfamily)